VSLAAQDQARISTLEVVPASEMERYAGRVLAGRYRIERHLASGTMGRVFIGTQLKLERHVAVKILRTSDQLADIRFKKRFCREASIAAQLAHPSIVSVYDYGETEDGDLFMVMELLPGRSLAQLMKDEGFLCPERALSIAIQIGRALRKAHSEGVVHRDLKPANIMVLTDEEGIDRVKVLDFGLVKMFAPEESDLSAPYTRDSLTRAGCMVGTPEYVAPEQALGDPVDGRVDIYSLGILLMQMVTGKLPYVGASIEAIVHQHFTAPIPQIAQLAPEVQCPEDIETIIRCAMAKVRTDRFETMSEMLAAMKTAYRNVMDESVGTEPSFAILRSEDLVPEPVGLQDATRLIAVHPSRGRRTYLLALCLMAAAMILVALAYFVTREARLLVPQPVLDPPAQKSDVLPKAPKPSPDLGSRSGKAGPPADTSPSRPVREGYKDDPYD
jgi:serine/threonine-protein kinase